MFFEYTSELRIFKNHFLTLIIFTFGFNPLTLNPLTASVPHDMESSQLILRANQLTCFYMMENTVVNGLNLIFVF